MYPAAFVLVSLFAVAPALCQQQPSLYLPEAIVVAVKSSPQARAAMFEHDAALARNGKEKPGIRPTIQAIASGGAQGPKLTYPGPPGTDTTVLPEEVGRLDLVIEQPLYHAGGKSARARYDAQNELADLDYRRALTAIAATVSRLFLDLRHAESAVRIAYEGVGSADRYRSLVQQMITAGSARPVDLQIAEGNLAEAHAGLSAAENGRKLVRLAILQALGRPLDITSDLAFIGVETDMKTEQALSGSGYDGVKSALRLRPDIIELQLELRAAKSGAVLAKSQSQPSVLARGQLTEQTPSAFVHEHYASAMLEIRLPILDNDKTRLDTREFESQVKRLEALLDQAKSGAALAVIRAWTQLGDAINTANGLRSQSASAEAAYTVAVTAYSVGRGTATDVKAAMREVKLAKEKQSEAAIAVSSARDEYNQAVGLVPSIIDTIAPLPLLQDNR